MRDAARETLDGAVAGVVATLAMSGALAVAAKAGQLREPPPRAIVRTALPGLSTEAVNTGAMLAHLGYGAAAGAVHRALLRGPGVAASVAYALTIWASAYEGWVPLLRALPPAHLDDRRRQASMVVGPRRVRRDPRTARPASASPGPGGAAPRHGGGGPRRRRASGAALASRFMPLPGCGCGRSRDASGRAPVAAVARSERRRRQRRAP